MSTANNKIFTTQFPQLSPGTLNLWLANFKRHLYLWGIIGAQLATDPPIPLIRIKPNRKDRQPIFFDTSDASTGTGGGGLTTPISKCSATDEYVFEHDPTTDQLTSDGRANYDEIYKAFQENERKFEDSNISMFTFMRDSISEDSRILMSTKPNYMEIDASGDPLALYNLVILSHNTKTVASAFHELSQFVNLQLDDGMKMETFIHELNVRQKEVMCVFGSKANPKLISVEAITLAIFLSSVPKSFKWKVETLLGDTTDVRDVNCAQTIADILAYKVRTDPDDFTSAPSAVGEALATETPRSPTIPTPSFKPSKATNTYIDGTTGPIHASNFGDGPPAQFCSHCYQRSGMFRNHHKTADCSHKVKVLPADARPLPTAAQLKSQAAHKTKPGANRKQALAGEQQLQRIQAAAEIEPLYDIHDK
jgi:hypothetical protein